MGEPLIKSESEFLSTRQVADILSVSQGSVRNWVRDGKLRAYKAGRLNRIRVQDLEDFLRVMEDLDAIDTRRVIEQHEEKAREAKKQPSAARESPIQSREYSRAEIDEVVKKDQLPEDLSRELDRILGK